MEKLYWKGRKIKNAVLFKIKAFFHKRRDELESKKDDLLFEKNVVKEVIKAFIKNICIIALILFLEQILVSEKCDGIFPYGLQKWIIKTNALVVEDRSLLTDVLSAIVGVALSAAEEVVSVSVVVVSSVVTVVSVVPDCPST